MNVFFALLDTAIENKVCNFQWTVKSCSGKNLVKWFIALWSTRTMKWRIKFRKFPNLHTDHHMFCCLAKTNSRL